MKNLTKTTMALLAAVSLSSCGTPAEHQDTAQEKQSKDVDEIVIDNIMSRRSIRRYTDQQVPRELLDIILRCGINAPNARNQQAYEVRVVDDASSVAYLHENFKGLYNAPVYIFIANEAGFNSSLIDAGLLSENICLAAWAYGLGTVNLGGPINAIKDNADVMRKLAFGEGYEPCLILALGYPDEAPEAKPRKEEKVQFVKIAE